jgi:hypothetical protein
MNKRRYQTKTRPIRIEGEVAYVPLTMGREAIIDAADVPLVSDRNWTLQNTRNKYAYRAEKIDGEIRRVWMHRLIAAPAEGLEVDHINGDGLDNRRANLRVCSHKENMWNRRISASNKTGVTGVIFFRGHYIANITHDGRDVYLGRFKSMDEAARTRETAEVSLRGEYTRLALDPIDTATLSTGEIEHLRVLRLMLKAARDTAWAGPALEWAIAELERKAQERPGQPPKRPTGPERSTREGARCANSPTNRRLLLGRC